MSGLGLSFKSEIGSGVAQASLTDGVRARMVSGLDASHARKDPILGADVKRELVTPGIRLG